MVIDHLALLIGAVSLSLLPDFSFLLITSIAAIAARKRPRDIRDLPAAACVGRFRFLVVIPAHDEEDVIATTVLSAKAMRYPPGLFQILLADNCTDRMAEWCRGRGSGSSSDSTRPARARASRSNSSSTTSAGPASSTNSTRWSSSMPTAPSPRTSSISSHAAWNPGRIGSSATIAWPMRTNRGGPG